MKPTPVPTVLGQPCWDTPAVARAVKIIANLDSESADYFLVTHSPFTRVRDEIARANINQETVFRRISDPAHGNVLAIIHGEPGTGKSHLIRWLHLRYQEDESTQARSVVPVLVQRRSGSLKDALEQVVEQLPPEFNHHTHAVREAIGNISAETAKETLLAQLQLELGPRWSRERGRTPLPRELRGVDQLCLSAGTRQWLLRDGGVVARNVARLTQASDIAERERLVEFSASDFAVQDAYKTDNTEHARALLDEFEWEDALREQTAEAFNSALRPALKEMSGLSGTRLRDVFDGVRADLLRANKSLALFIEDVSVMSSLDDEVLNAVEPQERADLCRMTAVVGITEEGARRLRDNQVQRFTHRFSLSEDIMSQWRTDPAAVAGFTARYLNAVRLREADVHRLAQGLRTSSKLTGSACEGCPVREPCHGTFGTATIDGQDIGLFPFSATAPQRLLTHLDEQIDSVRQNPRGLLERIVRPLLSDVHALERSTFPRTDLPVRLPPLPYWDQFESRFCGGDSWAAMRARLMLLAQGWVDARTADSAAAALEPFRSALGFPQFTSEAKSQPNRSQQIPQSPPKPAPAAPGQLQLLLEALTAWETGRARLDRDTDARELLLRLVRDSLPWEDEAVPLEVVSRFTTDKRYIKIEGQRSAPATTNFFIDRFPRSPETAALIRSLARFKYQGGDSWDYDGGEMDKRAVSQWLRRNRRAVVDNFDAPDGVIRTEPLDQAIRFLAGAAISRRGAQLASNSAEILRELLAPFGEPPQPITARDAALFREFADLQAKVRDFVLSELNVPQGRTGGIVFIDPTPVLRLLRDPTSVTVSKSLDPRYFSGPSQSRYAVLAQVRAFATIEEVLRERADAVRKRVIEILNLLRDAGISVQELASDLRTYLEQLNAVVSIQAQVMSLPDRDFDAYRATLAMRPSSIAETVGDAYSRASGTEPLKLLALNTGSFVLAADLVVSAASFLGRVSQELSLQERHLAADGDPNALVDAMDRSLLQLAQEPQ